MDKATFRRILRMLYWVPAGTALLLALTLVAEVRYLVERAAWAQHSDQVIAVAQRVFRNRVDQESSLRAYLLTDDRRFLEPFHQERDLSARLENELEQLISSDPNQQARNREALAAYQAWSAWADQALAMESAGQDPGELLFQLRGKELMDRYRQARTSFIDAEEDLRDQRLADSRRTVRWVTISLVPLCLLFAGFLTFVGRRQTRILAESFNTALDAAEASAAEAREQKESLRATLSSIGDAVIATDGAGAISFMNPVAEELTGWKSQEALRRPLAQVFRIVNQQTREPVEDPVDKVRRVHKVIGLANHTLLISRDGQEYVIDDSGAPIFHPNGALAGVVLVFRDVTRERALELALRSNERLALAGRLSASIAHEIHNPLDTVGNLLFLIDQKTDATPEIREFTRMARGELHHVTEISKNMLGLHRETRSPAPILLSDLLDGVVTLIDETLAKGKRQFVVDYQFNGHIEGFPAELRQVFTNLIKNAVEATREGDCIRISTFPVLDGGRDGVLVRVTDDGTGIASQMESKLFTAFATTKQENGTGLGLWISRSIIEQHGGQVRLSNRDDSPGATASVFLPLKIEVSA